MSEPGSERSVDPAPTEESGPASGVTPRKAGIWENLGASHGERPRRRSAVWLKGLVAPLVGLIALAALVVDEATAVDLGVWRGVALVLIAMVLAQLILRGRTEERSLGFYARFIRPGLKRLLEQEGRNMIEGDKLFRGRKAVLLKIDMVGYTKATFDMPYGMRRLFQDLWFTLIDQVVAERVFLDKSLGDGSIYCMENPFPGGACSGAVRCALEIRDLQVHRFDRVFNSRLKDQIAREPDLAGAAEGYFERYRERLGHDFWSRSTELRMALVTGYVDEGLWGLSSRSHYDVQGAPVILVTRLEDEARNGEIVMDRAFLDELIQERPDLDPATLEHRRPTLKGIGPWDVYAVPSGWTPNF